MTTLNLYEPQVLTDERTAQEEMKCFVNQWTEALVGNDVITLDRLCDDGLTISHIPNRLLTKKDWLEQISSGAIRYVKVGTSSLHLERADDLEAEISMTIHLTAYVLGAETKWSHNVWALLRRTSGGWTWTE